MNELARKHRTHLSILNRILKTAAIAVFAIIVFIIGSSMYFESILYKSGYEDGKLSVEVPANTSTSRVIAIFNESGALRPAWAFKLIAKGYSLVSGRTISPGYYRFPEKVRNIDILKSIFSGHNIFFAKVTFPEGIGFRRYASIIQERGGTDSIEFVRLATSDSLLKARGIKGKNVEGYLMPETYEFFMNTPADKVIDKLLDAGEKLWNAKFAARAGELGWSRLKVLTLASIIEAETPVAAERKRIAGVYLNRLNKGWLLQADPTVLYAAGKTGKLTYADLAINNPYNTYKFRGLPPGPINSPGRASIEAALYPEKHSFMYFVAVGDGSGRHNFSTSLSGHSINVRKYRDNTR